ncbi:MAG: hypothetical protein WA029_00770 [Anaerolineae bacterium]
MGETERLGTGHAANIGGMDGGEEQAAPVRRASSRRKVSATASGGAEARSKRVAKPTGAAGSKTTTRRKAAEDQTGAAGPKKTTRRKAAEDQTGATKPKTTTRRRAAEDQTGAAKPKTTARPRTSGVRRGSGATAKPATTRPATGRKATPRTGSALDQDLAQHAAETYTEADLEAGKKLAVSIVSKTVTSGGLASLLSVLMPGAAAGAGGLTALLSKLSATYGDLSAQDQKHLRAVVAWVKGGFHLKLEPYTASGHELRLFP